MIKTAGCGEPGALWPVHDNANKAKNAADNVEAIRWGISVNL